MGRRVHEPDKTKHGVQQVFIEPADRQRPDGPAWPRNELVGLDQHRSNQGAIEDDAYSEIRSLGGCFDDMARQGNPGRDEQVGRGIVAVTLLAEDNHFASLGDDAEGRLSNAIERAGPARHAGEDEARSRLEGPVLREKSRDPLREFVPARSGLLELAPPRQ